MIGNLAKSNDIKDGIENLPGTNHGAVYITATTTILSTFPFYLETKISIIYRNAQIGCHQPLQNSFGLIV